MRFLLFIYLFSTLLFLTNSITAKERQYKLLQKENNIEIRYYNKVMSAQVTITGNRKTAASSAFRVLFKFIDGNNNKNQKIPMTSPVSQISSSKITWDITFFMPASMIKGETPTPLDSRIKIIELNQIKLAAIRFSGRASTSNLENHTSILRDYLIQNKLQFINKPHYAFYNAPFVPWFLRRNEVLFELIDPQK
ncbi:hypothetical protein DID75_05325 [Candidatus Marinamargulisbacteria bacterium SCGC AG-410-N11]|nr:hypothetical protein DID75_05325 [Candidatus Marinamargulisbacteria bacterium SCGC AG-410-N11]